MTAAAQRHPLAVRGGWWAIPLWALALGLGFFVLRRYEGTPGAGGGPPARWPGNSAIVRARGLPTLLMFAHPRCVCTRASLAELERLQGRLEGRLAVDVVFLRPADAGADWDGGDLWQKAAAMRGVTVVRDIDGRESLLFGAATSGHTLVYDAEGRLLFSGGLTAARGREGEALGAKRIMAVLETGRADRNASPVFGCALHYEEAVGGALAPVGRKEVGDDQ